MFFFLYKTTPINRDEAEIAGYRSALDLIHNNYEHMDLSPNVIRQLHKMLYQYSGQLFGGQYKKTDNIIEEKDYYGNRYVRFIPVKPHLVEGYLDTLCKEYNYVNSLNIIDPLFIIPIFIFDFLCIHPFNDGNGRLSRLITLLLLYKAGYIVGKYISIEKIIEDSKETYYDVLLQGNNGWHENINDNTLFTKYFLGTVVNAYRKLEERYIIVNVSRLTSKERIENYISKSIIPVSKKDIVNNLSDISQITIERHLNSLLKEDKLIKVGNGRATKYKHS